MKNTAERITRDEAKRLAGIFSSVIPNSRVRLSAWNVTVISRSGKHIACWTGNRDGFRRAH